jgi:hypothetical protein
MKADQLISRYLAIHGAVSLQGIGRFIYEVREDASGDIEKTPNFSDDSIRFEFDKNASEDNQFIDFLSEKTGKKRSLIASDLESFILTGKQFLNIGKPLIIKDLGILLKNQQGTYEFTQGSNTHEPIDISGPKSNQQQSNPDEIDFSSIPKKKAGNKSKGLIFTIALLVLLLVILILNFNSKENKSSDLSDEPADTSLSQSGNAKIDSAGLSNSITDSNQFMIVKSFKTINEAQTIQSKFLGMGYDIQLNAKDSNEFSLCVIMPRKISDTTFVKDSIQKAMNLQFDIKPINRP